MLTEDAPQRHLLAGVLHIEPSAGAEDEVVGDRYLDVPEPRHFVGHGDELLVDRLQERPVAILTGPLQVAGFNEEIVEFFDAQRGAAMEGKGLVLDLAKEIENAEAVFVHAHLLRLPAAPVEGL